LAETLSDWPPIILVAIRHSAETAQRKTAQFANLLRKGTYRDYMKPEDELKSAIV
jgi:hypothetical protein